MIIYHYENWYGSPETLEGISAAIPSICDRTAKGILSESSGILTRIISKLKFNFVTLPSKYLLIVI